MILPKTIQNELNEKAPNIKRIRILSLIFFTVLFVVILGVTYIKFAISPYIDMAGFSGMYIVSAISILLILLAQQIYLMFTRRELFSNPRELYLGGVVIAFGFIVILFIEMLGIFAVPTALVAFVTAPLFRKKSDAFTANLFCNFLVLTVFTIEHIYAGSYASYRILDIIASFNIGVIGGALAAYFVNIKSGRLKQLLRGLAVCLIIYAFIIIYALLQGTYRAPIACPNEVICSITIYAALSLGAIAAFMPLLMTLILQPILEWIFNLLTNARLVDLTDHNTPLLTRLRLEAPGSFSHSLTVASFAEMCASAIGENPYLARAAAYYHDVGKLKNPAYYKENQDSKNLHDELMPEVSVEIIRAHTEDGLALCDEHRIPREISHVTVQHHGTLLIPVFYDKAKMLTDNPVEKTEYSYRGVTPRSKIAAIIMICDAAEAAIRSMDKPNSEKIEVLLTNIISERIESKQFDKCEISLKDLTTIKNTIIAAYGGLYHSRIKYPDGK
ncbi:MAG: HDIG domain-containing protein [Firmicutes bacterium]|nr:HDIG domain-containing protein [Bacillota bacterium]